VPTTQTPALKSACRKVAEELVDEASTLAEFVASFSSELTRGQQFVLLKRLADIGRRLNHTLKALCNLSEQKELT
jgi:hypothetical protein